MATVITEDCINCGACEPECPNTAIYQGGVEYDWNGAKSPALSNDFFYIVPEKCTECVGFFDEEACAVVSPVALSVDASRTGAHTNGPEGRRWAFTGGAPLTQPSGCSTMAQRTS